MSKEILEKRIVEIQQAINESAASYKNVQGALEQAAAHHNSLLGRLNETQFLLSEMFKSEVEGESKDASS